MARTLAELAKELGVALRGNPDVQIRGVASMARAKSDELVFLSDEKYLSSLASCAAGAVLLHEKHLERYSGNALVTKNPHLSFARAATLLTRRETKAEVHPTALIHEGARVSPLASIGPYCVIESGARIEDEACLGAGCFIGANAVIGKSAQLSANVYVGERCEIGERTVIHAGAVVGSDGFGFAKDGERWIKVPQLGRVMVGSDVEIGANTTIDRGALDDTVIGNGVKLDNLIQIAHNVRIGDHCAIAAQVGIAGSAVIGKRCTIGGQAGIIGHLEIADDVHITATSLVTGDLPSAGTYASNLKATAIQDWRRAVARLMQIDTLAKRLKRVEEELQLQKSGSGK